MKRNLSEWASIAEILGAAAIVVSLVFVGLQIRNSSQSTQAAMFQQHMANEVAFLEHITSDRELTAAYNVILNAPESLESLDELDQLRALGLLIAEMRLFEDVYLQWYSGTLSEFAWKSREGLIRSRASHPLFIDMVDEGAITGVFAEYLADIREAGP